MRQFYDTFSITFLSRNVLFSLGCYKSGAVPKGAPRGHGHILTPYGPNEVHDKAY